MAPALQGEMAPEAALRQLLEGSGLTFSKGAKGDFRIVSDGRSSSQQQPAPATSQVAFLDDGSDLLFDEIIVTGSNIRGVEASSSPVQRFDSRQIEMSGVSNTEQFIATLPQNHSSGSSERAYYDGTSGGTNIAMGTGVNLRGIGNDSTLVLLNGRRMAMSGLGTYVDISMIPLNALESVEVLSDGASAIYGSDAVGGVVNFKLKDQYDGAETAVSYGTYTGKDADQVKFSQSLGGNWEGGFAIAGYEHAEYDRLEGATLPNVTSSGLFSIVPKRHSDSIFLTAEHEISDRLEIFGTGFYSDKYVLRDFDLLIPTVYESQVENISGIAGAYIDLGAAWRLETSAAYSRTNTQFQDTTAGFAAEPADISSDGWAFDAKADGPLLELPGGEVKLAVGGQYRRERNNDRNGYGTDSPYDRTRKVSAAFAEMHIPLFDAENKVPGIEHLFITVAGRYEHYSDFGSTTNPKVGFNWSPLPGLALRGSYGTSFRAPLMNELNNLSGNFIIQEALNGPDIVTILALTGNNAELEPEEATTYSLGFDFRPEALPGLTISGTYFNIDYRDRIDSPLSLQRGDFFTNPVFDPFLNYNPTAGEVDAAVNLGAQLSNFSFLYSDTATALANLDAIIDFRLQNLARTTVDGFDFQLGYSFETGIGDFSITVAGTYLASYENQYVPGADVADVLNTAYNPVGLNMRNSLVWSKSGLSSALHMNYVDSYRHVLVTPEARVPSWTTFDWNMSYNTGDGLHTVGLNDVTLSVSVRNLFNKDAPFVSSPYYGVNFDGANADPKGRFVLFRLKKQW